MEQFIPPGICLKCDICCRYLDRNTAYVPVFFRDEIAKADPDKKLFYPAGQRPDTKIPPKAEGKGYACVFFDPGSNACRVYPNRPLDCSLYPFMITYDKLYRSVILALDLNCPYAREHKNSPELKEYAERLALTLENDRTAEQIRDNKNFVNDFQEDSLPVKKLDTISRAMGLVDGLRRVSLSHKNIFNEYLSRANSELSSFSFSAIYPWSGILNILWKELDGNLCVFAGNDKDYFLLLPPAGGKSKKNIPEQASCILKNLNKDLFSGTRIENAEASFADISFTLTPSAAEYVYLREELSELKGASYGSRRAAINHFIKHNDFSVRPLEQKDVFSCLELYGKWLKNKMSRASGSYERILAEDGYFCQKKALMNLAELDISGIVTEINGEIRAYSAGFALNKETFVIFFETADLSVKGLAQFIFREFARRADAYKHINTMSDSGLQGLKDNKNLYRPFKTIPILTAFRDAASSPRSLRDIS